MKINLLIAFESEFNSELTYFKNMDENKQIEVSKNKDEAKRLPFNDSTFNELYKLPKAMMGLCLQPVFIFERVESIGYEG